MQGSTTMGCSDLAAASQPKMLEAAQLQKAMADSYGLLLSSKAQQRFLSKCSVPSSWGPYAESAEQYNRKQQVYVQTGCMSTTTTSSKASCMSAGRAYVYVQAGAAATPAAAIPAARLERIHEAIEEEELAAPQTPPQLRSRNQSTSDCIHDVCDISTTSSSASAAVIRRSCSGSCPSMTNSSSSSSSSSNWPFDAASSYSATYGHANKCMPATAGSPAESSITNNTLKKALKRTTGWLVDTFSLKKRAAGCRSSLSRRTHRCSSSSSSNSSRNLSCNAKGQQQIGDDIGCQLAVQSVTASQSSTSTSTATSKLVHFWRPSLRAAALAECAADITTAAASVFSSPSEAYVSRGTCFSGSLNSLVLPSASTAAPAAPHQLGCSNTASTDSAAGATPCSGDLPSLSLPLDGSNGQGCHGLCHEALSGSDDNKTAHQGLCPPVLQQHCTTEDGPATPRHAMEGIVQDLKASETAGSQLDSSCRCDSSSNSATSTCSMASAAAGPADVKADVFSSPDSHSVSPVATQPVETLIRACRSFKETAKAVSNLLYGPISAAKGISSSSTSGINSTGCHKGACSSSSSSSSSIDTTAAASSCQTARHAVLGHKQNRSSSFLSAVPYRRAQCCGSTGAGSGSENGASCSSLLSSVGTVVQLKHASLKQAAQAKEAAAAAGAFSNLCGVGPEPEAAELVRASHSTSSSSSSCSSLPVSLPLRTEHCCSTCSSLGSHCHWDRSGDHVYIHQAVVERDKTPKTAEPEIMPALDQGTHRSSSSGGGGGNTRYSAGLVSSTSAELEFWSDGHSSLQAHPAAAATACNAVLAACQRVCDSAVSKRRQAASAFNLCRCKLVQLSYKLDYKLHKKAVDASIDAQMDILPSNTDRRGFKQWPCDPVSKVARKQRLLKGVS